jgi:hypothetical protein
MKALRYGGMKLSLNFYYGVLAGIKISLDFQNRLISMQKVHNHATFC